MTRNELPCDDANFFFEAFLSSYSTVFWDFDGVIKDSVAVKTNAYISLFSEFGNDVRSWIKTHHERHGGMSRYQKIPIYLAHVGLPTDPRSVEHYCSRFSQEVLQRVIDAPWVPGVKTVLQSKPWGVQFVLVTATPKFEIIEIISKLGLASCFDQIHGAPANKSQVISNYLETAADDSSNAVMIGDAESDYNAAVENSISFLLRKTSLNEDLQMKFEGLQVEDFCGG